MMKCILLHKKVWKKSLLTVEWSSNCSSSAAVMKTFGHDICPSVNTSECARWKSPVVVYSTCLSALSHSLTAGPAGGDTLWLFSSLFVLAQSSLLLCVLYCLLLHVEAFAATDSVHVFEGLICGVRFLTKVQIFFLCGGNPVRITADRLGHRQEERDRNTMVSDGMSQHFTSVHVIFILVGWLYSSLNTYEPFFWQKYLYWDFSYFEYFVYVCIFSALNCFRLPFILLVFHCQQSTMISYTWLHQAINHGFYLNSTIRIRNKSCVIFNGPCGDRWWKVSNALGQIAWFALKTGGCVSNGSWSEEPMKN